MIKNTCMIIMFMVYMLAGINHFIHPDGYLKIIPDYLPAHHTLNLLAGGFEILLAILLLIPLTRRLAAWGIIIMLVAFLPVHIAMIEDAPLQVGRITVTPVLAWVRLVLIQPVLILWAWWYTKPV
ncbi:DoxX family protein [Mucilaginibacter hurinus]|uniref:DoxX family protein n=1 Tax=Mucilaginibacter hurinus TaxID=2201324 RepID=A0A367GNL5_9SPHI|nr:MauE/DoxX family redox-associated membrane protein [Mucilaginibacter hurinus]RCH54283.1 DoxX family protein [Mucilaginibacter hurinus]